MDEVSQRRPLEGWERAQPNNSAPSLEGREQLLPTAANFDASPPPPPPPAASAHKFDRETYVVQMPKDQIYRVPPPENNELVERLRKNPAKKNDGKGRCYLWTCLTILLILTLFVSTIVILVFVVFRPMAPILSVSSIVAVESKSGAYKELKISLSAKNPNKGLEMDYENQGEASLIFEGKHVGGGKTPHLFQTKDAYADLKVAVKPFNSTYPEEMERSMNEKKSELPVLLKLNIKLSLKCTLSSIKTWKSELEVDCKFKVSSLRKGAKILSQKCDSRMEFY